MSLEIQDSRGLALSVLFAVALVVVSLCGFALVGYSLVEQPTTYEYTVTIQEISSDGSEPDVMFEDLSDMEKDLITETMQDDEDTREFHRGRSSHVTEGVRSVGFNGGVMVVSIEGDVDTQPTIIGMLFGFGFGFVGAYALLRHGLFEDINRKLGRNP